MNDKKSENDRIRQIMDGDDDAYEKLSALGDMFDEGVRYNRNAMAPGIDMTMAWRRWQSMAIKMGRMGLVLHHIMSHHDLRPGSTIATSIVCDREKMRSYIYMSGDDLQSDIVRLRTILDDTPAWETWGRMWEALLAPRDEKNDTSEQENDALGDDMHM